MSLQLHAHEALKKEIKFGFTSRVATLGGKFNTRYADAFDSRAKDVLARVFKATHLLESMQSLSNDMQPNTLQAAGECM